MGLLQRVARLVRANLNDLIDRAEDPQKMLKQVILDMQNQLMQVKTQTAIAVADQHLLEKKHTENSDAAAEFIRKAELAVAKGRDDLARPAIEQSVRHRQMAEALTQQREDQKAQVIHLKAALRQLEAKLTEAQTRSELLLAQHRRARALSRATDARVSGNGTEVINRARDKVLTEESMAAAKAELAAPDSSAELMELERNDEIEKILSELRIARGSR